MNLKQHWRELKVFILRFYSNMGHVACDTWHMVITAAFLAYDVLAKIYCAVCVYECVSKKFSNRNINQNSSQFLISVGWVS